VNKTQIIQELKMIKPILKEKYGVTDIALFGSYSRDEATAKSDIDLLIHFEKPSADALFESYDLLQNTFKDITVQVVSRKAIKPLYFQAIKQDLIYA
jgi:predicted nucleotidyltransferase